MAPDSTATSPFHALFEQIGSLFEKNENLSRDSGALVILDDVSSLEWMGYSTSDLCRFCRALRALCSKVNHSEKNFHVYKLNIWYMLVQNQATLLIRHHITQTSGDLDMLFRRLYALCTYHLDIQPLNSGRSGAVSGQVSSFHSKISQLNRSWLDRFTSRT